MNDKNDMKPFFDAIIPVGPSGQEVARFQDLIASLVVYEKNTLRRIVVVDDSPAVRTVLHEILQSCPFESKIIINPRRGYGDPWLGGLACGIISGLQEFIDNPALFVLKLDTDSLLIRSVSTDVRQVLTQHPTCAMIGAYRNFPHRPRDWHQEREPAPALEKLMRPMTIWRRTFYRWPRLQCALFPNHRFIRRLILDALLAGYVLGEYCVGGAYALRSDFITKAQARGCFKRPIAWANTPCSEDVVVSLMVKLLGYAIQDDVHEGAVFGVGNPTLPFEPAEMVRKGYGIVHPIKDKNPQIEVRSSHS
jgi:hypothetical protein